MVSQGSPKPLFSVRIAADLQINYHKICYILYCNTYIYMSFSDKKIKTIVLLLQRFYFIVFILLVSLFLLLVFLLITGNFQSRQPILPMFIQSIPTYIICGVFYFGLKNKRYWIIPVAMLSNTYGLLSILFSSPKNLLYLIVKIFTLSLTVFELYFFSRKEVRKYFKSKGLFLFGR